MEATLYTYAWVIFLGALACIMLGYYFIRFIFWHWYKNYQTKKPRGFFSWVSRNIKTIPGLEQKTPELED